MQPSQQCITQYAADVDLGIGKNDENSSTALILVLIKIFDLEKIP